VKNGRAEKEKNMNANYKSIILVISLLFALSASISAAPGDLDPTFGNGGIVITRDSSNYQINFAYGMAIQSDGKIIIVGDGVRNPPSAMNWDSAVVRYNPDGSLDTSFGGTGIVITQLSIDYDAAQLVAVQADGKIVVAGTRANCYSCLDYSLAVVRYNPDGSLDTSFNGTGIVITSGVASAGGLAIQADGKIVAAGYGGNDIAVVRYNSNGSLDTIFNGTGKILIPKGNGNSYAPSVVLQADGKVVVTRSGYNGSVIDFTIFRYKTDGSPDTTFNGTGQVTTSGFAGGELALQPDGKIVVAGSSYDSSVGDRLAVARFNPDGSLDTSFNGTGIVITSAGAGAAQGLAIQSDGKIVTGGSNFSVVRFNPNGSPDTTFNGTDLATRGYSIAVAIQADGKIVVAGNPDEYGGEYSDFMVVRYQGDVAPAACPNPIDCADFFVRQHYRDFLNREPDDAGLAFWTNEITLCGSDQQCIEAKRINVSAAYFISIEFQQTGYLAYRTYKAAYGNLPNAPVPIKFDEFLTDTQQIGQGVIVNQAGWEQLLETNKHNFFSAFVQRSRFTSAYPASLTPDQFVDQLFVNAGVTPSVNDRAGAINEFGGAMTTDDVAARARTLRRIAENSTLAHQEFNRAFVLMQYFGYLRRNPNDLPDTNFDGYNFWLDKLNQFNGDYLQAEMVKAFLVSNEYRHRFGL
jgi:uncharacterized delta-60 repeat protein